MEDTSGLKHNSCLLSVAGIWPVKLSWLGLAEAERNLEKQETRQPSVGPRATGGPGSTGKMCQWLGLGGHW